MVFLRLAESLIDLQGKVAQVVKAVCVSVDDLDLIVVITVLITSGEELSGTVMF